MMRGVNLLGEDGNGYELALKLEGCGAWKAWFDGGSGIYGDGYSKFVSFLSSPAAWESFMSSSPPTDSSSSRQILHLQLRTRALLFDKASVSLFLSSSNHNDNDDNSLSHLNPQYLQLHGDDIFFSLEPEDDEDDDECDVKLDNKKTNNIITNKKKNNNSKNNADANSYQVHPRHSKKGNEKHPSHDERSSTAGSQRHSSSSNSNRNEVLPKTWYNQYIDKLRANYPKFPNCEKESLKRTSEGMAAYLHHSEIHKSKRKALLQQDDICLIENGTCDDKDFSFFPEITFPSNCVPASALPLKYESEKNHSVLEFHGILDNLPNVASKSTAMMERFGIKPDYIKVGSKYRGVDGSGCEKKPLCQEQALVMTQQVVARLLYNTGFKGGTANSMEVFSEFFCERICKLGRVLKLLTDSYRKQYSSIELLQMFLQSIGQSNLGDLEESKKDGNKGLVLGSPSQVRAGQPQNQNSLLQAQHIQRQMQTQPNMSMINLQKMTFQQQQPQMRKQQSSNQLMPDVKIENTIESSPIEGPTLHSTLSKQQQHHLQQQRQMLQIRQQQQLLQQHMTVPQSTQQQFRHLQSAQVSQLQTQDYENNMKEILVIDKGERKEGAEETMVIDKGERKEEAVETMVIGKGERKEEAEETTTIDKGEKKEKAEETPTIDKGEKEGAEETPTIDKGEKEGAKETTTIGKRGGRRGRKIMAVTKEEAEKTTTISKRGGRGGSRGKRTSTVIEGPEKTMAINRRGGRRRRK